MVLSPSAGVFVVWPFFLNSHMTKTPAEEESTIGYMYNLDLLMMGLWGLKHVEERGNPDTVYRLKRIVYQVGNKDKINYTEMHGQQNIKNCILCLKKLKKETIFYINTHFMIRTTHVEFQTSATIVQGNSFWS